MTWTVKAIPDFTAWLNELGRDELASVAASVNLLENYGPQLVYPYSSAIAGSRLSHLRELRIQHKGQPYRVLYAFDPARAAVLLLGGNKKGDDRWYDVHVPLAERRYDEYLAGLAKRKE